MSKVFRITPKQVYRRNGTVLTPEMTVIVTTKQNTLNPFNNGAKEVIAAYMREYGYDYKKAGMNSCSFTYERLD